MMKKERFENYTSWKCIQRAILGLCLLLLWTSFPACSVADDSESIFKIEIINTREIKGFISTSLNETIIIDWGDGTQNSFSGQRQSYSRDFGEKISGTLDVLAPEESILTEFTVERTDAEISFEIEHLPQGLKHLEIMADNTINGDISSLPVGLVHFNVRGQNSIYGNIADLPVDLTHFDCTGNNNLTGDITELPRDLTSFMCYGRNRITGNIAGLPEKLEHFDLRGNNTVSGDISELPPILAYFDCFGDNDISGDIAKMPGSVTFFRCAGNNTIRGNISELPDITRFVLRGLNSISGNIADIPDRLNSFEVSGLNTLTGDIADLPDGLYFFDCRGQNTISDYTAGRAWAENMRRIRIEPAPGNGLSSEDVDNLLIDLSGTSWRVNRLFYIWLAGNNSPRSSASDDAVSILEKKGVPVTVNIND